MLGPASVLWLAEHEQADQQGVWLALVENCGGLASWHVALHRAVAYGQIKAEEMTE